MPENKPHIGVLVVNLGTPNAPDTGAVRRYLKEFLSDRRVVEVPRLLWWLILNAIILRIRPAKSAKNYRKIWTPQGSPLLFYTQSIVRQLQERFDRRHPGRILFAAAMRYGQPSLAVELKKMLDAGVNRLVVIPLFPQYSATTTGSVFDCIGEVLKRQRYIPHLRVVGDYHSHPRYVEAIANRVAKHWQEKGPAEKLLMSFHGIPQRYADKGDPYAVQCAETASQVANKLNLRPDQWALAFQSRFGKATWLQPYTDATLRTWARVGIQSVAVTCPGFSVDCLETVEEIAGENAELFLHHGGQAFHYIPALNDGQDQIELLSELVENNTRDW